MVRAVSIALALVCAFRGCAQVTCMEQLLGAVENMRQMVDSSPDHTLTAELEITSISSAQDARPSTLRTRQVSGNDHLIVENEVFSQYEDEETRVVVLHPEKMVLLSDQTPQWSTIAWGHSQQFSDTLWRTARVSACRRTKQAGAAHVEVELTVPDSLVLGGIDKLRYYVDLDQKLVRSITMTYRPNQKLRSYTLRYIDFKPGSTDKRLHASAISNVLKGTKLAPRLADHTLRDRRHARSKSPDHAH